MSIISSLKTTQSSWWWPIFSLRWVIITINHQHHHHSIFSFLPSIGKVLGVMFTTCSYLVPTIALQSHFLITHALSLPFASFMLRMRTEKWEPYLSEDDGFLLYCWVDPPVKNMQQGQHFMNIYLVWHCLKHTYSEWQPNLVYLLFLYVSHILQMLT